MKAPTTASRLALRDYPSHLMPVMENKWRNLLFLHWEFDASEIQKTLPPGLYVDTFQGKAYVGIIPLFIHDVRVKGVPSFLIPSNISDLLELNLRTYVYDEEGTPGVWFYTLEANNWLAVQMASRFLSLPYFYSQINASVGPDHKVSFLWQRPQTNFSSQFDYQPTGEQFTANDPESLEFFLVERYALFAYTGSKIISGRVHHVPYPISKANVTSWNNALFEVGRLAKPERQPDHILFSPGVNVEIFVPQK